MKLVRNRIPGLHPQWQYREAKYPEIPRLLRDKLNEEAQEFWDASDTENAIEELADLYEVVRLHARYIGVPWYRVEMKAEDKIVSRGDFSQMIVSEGSGNQAR
jgi:predicted house-cleaning noncanonical NTP pyrophosphatase (MazG superfamily)